MKITAVIPVRGRVPLVKRTVRRLRDMGVTVVAAVSTWDDMRAIETMCEKCEMVSRMALGRKWDIIYEMAKETKPDVVMHLGSDDWFTENWVDDLTGWLNNYDIVGVGDYHFAHWNFHITRGWDGYPLAAANRDVSVVYWGGYDLEKAPHRKDEPIGGGRLIRAEMLDMIDWHPFDKNSVKNLDFEMMNKLRDAGAATMVVKKDSLKAMSITTNLWPCKNGFNKMVSNNDTKMLDVQFLKEHFPEAYEIWE